MIFEKAGGRRQEAGGRRQKAEGSRDGEMGRKRFFPITNHQSPQPDDD
jgi:hypothetical protein